MLLSNQTTKTYWKTYLKTHNKVHRLARISTKSECRFASKGQGKSGGARVITCVKIVKEKIFLVAIYDKSEMEVISEKELSERLKGIVEI